MKKIFLNFVCFLLMAVGCFSQIGVNADRSQPDPSAGLDVNFTNKGLLPPRMTTSQMQAIVSPSEGLTVYNTTVKSLCWFNGISWDIGTNRDRSSCGMVFYGGIFQATIIIGVQCWMKENVNIGVMIPGSQHQTNNGTIEKYCYGDLEANCAVYGGLYEWDELMNYTTISGGKGICPTNWHVPSDAEWTQLSEYLGGGFVAGGKMKETGTTHWSSPNTGATNSSGFTALPGGGRDFGGVFTSVSINAYCWSSTDYIFLKWVHVLHYNNAQVDRWEKPPDLGFSGRCLKD